MLESSLNSEEFPFKKNSVAALTVLFAFCSILYELLLAQTLSSTMGNTILRYNMTIGIYVASMGFGAIVYSKYKKREIIHTLLLVEFFLACTGFLAPFFVLIFDGVMFHHARTMNLSYYSPSIQYSIFFVNHMLILTIGFLSGFELPLLMDIFKTYSCKSSLGILGLDYIGTLIGAMLFPLTILPFFSIFQIGAMVSMLNLIGALYLGVFISEKKYPKLIFILIVMLLLVTIDFFGVFDLENLILTNFYYR